MLCYVTITSKKVKKFYPVQLLFYFIGFLINDQEKLKTTQGYPNIHYKDIGNNNNNNNVTHQIPGSSFSWTISGELKVWPKTWK